MKKLVVLILLPLLVVAMSGTALGAVQFVEGFNVSAQVNNYANYEAGYTFGLKYIPTVSYNLKKVELMAGVGTGPFTVQLRPDSGGWPSSTILLGTTFTMVDTVSWQGAEFSSSYPVAAGTTYWIVFKPVNYSQASIRLGSGTPVTAVSDDGDGDGWDEYVINPYSGQPFPWMAKFYKDTGGAGYDVTIWAWIQNEGWMDWLPITMDGVPTGYVTPHTFTGLTGTHTFTVPSTEPWGGHVFYEWSTGWTGTTLTVNSAGTYTARYRDPTVASLTVTSPNGGESWVRGSTHAITWTSTGSVGANVKIELLKSGAVLGGFTTANSGSYSWTIQSALSVGSDYRIRITSTSNPAITDSSDNNFAITAGGTGTLTVTSPNGGESWVRGSTHAITWTSTGSVGANVKIELLKSGAVLGGFTTANSGSYSWTIQSALSVGSDYRIRITSTSNPAITDSSNNNFAIG